MKYIESLYRWKWQRDIDDQTDLPSLNLSGLRMPQGHPRGPRCKRAMCLDVSKSVTKTLSSSRMSRTWFEQVHPATPPRCPATPATWARNASLKSWNGRGCCFHFLRARDSTEKRQRHSFRTPSCLRCCVFLPSFARICSSSRWKDWISLQSLCDRLRERRQILRRTAGLRPPRSAGRMTGSTSSGRRNGLLDGVAHDSLEHDRVSLCDRLSPSSNNQEWQYSLGRFPLPVWLDQRRWWLPQLLQLRLLWQVGRGGRRPCARRRNLGGAVCLQQLLLKFTWWKWGDHVTYKVMSRGPCVGCLA